MFKVTVSGVYKGYSDTVVFIRLHSNGCYIPCDEAEAEGICVKIPQLVKNEDGEERLVPADIVFMGRDYTLEPCNGAATAAEAEDIIRILTGGT